MTKEQMQECADLLAMHRQVSVRRCSCGAVTDSGWAWHMSEVFDRASTFGKGDQTVHVSIPTDNRQMSLFTSTNGSAAMA